MAVTMKLDGVNDLLRELATLAPEVIPTVEEIRAKFPDKDAARANAE